MDQEKKNLKGWRQNMMITKTVQKWLKTSRKTPQFNEDLRNFTTSRERRSKIITPLHNVIFDMVAQNFKIDNKEVVEGFLDSELNSDIMMSFFASGGMFAIHFTYGLFPPAPDSSGRYSSQEQRRQAALANRIIMTNTEFKELKESCVMIYRVKNTEHLNIRNYQDLVFSRYYGPLNEKETSLTRFTNDIEDFLKFDRMESVEKTIASSQEFSPVSPRTICKKLHSVVHDLKMIDNAIQKRPVFEIDQQLFKGFLVTDLMIEETLRIPEKVAEVEKIFTKWIKQFEEILVRGHQMYKHLPNADICHELQYWRDIVIQYSYVEKWIEEKEFTSVVKCLTMAGSSLITKWKDLRNQLHSAIMKTTDKCKFLESIEIFFRDLSDQSPKNIHEQLSGLIKLIKSSSNKICEFFGILNNQLVMFCVNFIEGNSEFFWQQDRAMLIEKINISRHLLNTFEETYMTLNNWECSQQHIFIEKTHFMEKINKIENVLNIIESFATLDRVRMSTMKEFNGRMKANFKEMISDSMSPLDKSYRDFDSRYTTFIAETNTIETEIYQMIRTIIAECPTSMHILLTINQYKRFNLRSLCINEHYLTVIEKLEGEFGEIFKKYEVTVTSDEELLPSQKIKYLRSFLASVEEPIKEIQDNGSEELEQALENCLSRRESIIFIFDTEEKTIFSNWCKTINQVHSALNEPVFVMDTNKPGYLVNFNEKIYLAIKEANSMLKLGFALSKEIKIILHCGENFLKNRDLLRDLTKRDRIVRESLPLIFVAIMTPQLRSLDLLFKKGRTTIAWTSSSLPSYIEELRSAIDSLSHHVKQLRDQKDIIDENLQVISQLMLIRIPENPMNIKDFRKLNDDHLAETAKDVSAKSIYIEKMVINILHKFCDTVDFSEHDKDGQTQFLTPATNPADVEHLPIDKFDWINFVNLPQTITVHEENCESFLYKDFDQIWFEVKDFHACCMEVFNFFYDQLLNNLAMSCLASIEMLKKLINPAFAGEDTEPIFLANLILQIPDFKLFPAKTELEDNIQNIANNVMIFFGNIDSWGFQAKTTNRQRMQPSESERQYPKNVYGFIVERVDMAQIDEDIRLNIDTEVNRLIQDLYNDYEYLWTLDRFNVNKQIVQLNLTDLEIKEILEEISTAIKDAEDKVRKIFNYFPLRLSIEKAMKVIVLELWSWRADLGVVICRNIQQKINQSTKTVQELSRCIGKPIKDVKDIPKVFECLKTIRSSSFVMRQELDNISEILTLLQQHDIEIIDSDLDAVYQLNKDHKELLELEVKTRKTLLSMAEPLIENLKLKISTFEREWSQFELDYQESGPIIPTIAAKTASDRLFIFTTRFDDLFSEYLTIQSGVNVFGLPPMENKDIMIRKKELELLRKLYNIYNETLNLDATYRETKWKKVSVEQMQMDLKDILSRFTRLPPSLRQWKAYDETKRLLTEMTNICPLIELLRHPAMKDHHWKSLSQVLETFLDASDDKFVLGTILNAPILQKRDQVEDIGIAAMKEREIEEKLRQIDETWSSMTFPVIPFKGKSNFLLKGTETQDLLAQIDDTLLILNSLAANRYNEVFMKKTLLWIDKLRRTGANLDLWLQVQNLWLYLEAVFMSGDISRQLPVETKVFANIDMNYSRIVYRALSIDKLVECCIHPDLQTCFPLIMEQLEQCLKSLSSYLEKKRKMFPRFYFISDAILIEILGQSTTPSAMQPFFPSLFAGIAKVDFKENTTENIEAILSTNGERVILSKPVICSKVVEIWLGELLKEMQDTIKSLAADTAKSVIDEKFDFIKEFNNYTGQLGIIGLQILWTHISEKAFKNSKKNSDAMKQTDKVFLNLLNQLIDQTTSELTILDRTKYEAMITIHLHQRDIFHALVMHRVSSSLNFEWQKQQRFYHIEQTDEIVVKITNVRFIYQNEYLGVTDRLVITPLTDRCYITLAQAISLNMGGSPIGPAGTGKTETTLDMGKSLGKYVVVFNCSDQMDYRGLGQIFKGLSASGSWGCFDEFNRIELSVLSVAAQQISILLTARKEQKQVFTFSDGNTLKLNMECGVFITMNPGYAGRQELPENLKVMFRTVSMMVPDREIIIRVKLASCGFKENAVLARKFITLYQLCENQLSNQVHYDFGLRNILSVLRILGVQKRTNTKESEQATVMRVLKDMNLSKLIAEDKPIFLSLINDIFPGIRLMKSKYDDLQESIKKFCTREKLVNAPDWNLKIQQLYETCLVRHGIMVMGESFTGKTTAMKVLLEHYANMGQKYQTLRMNPKAITASQMFGKLDVATNEWTDGIFSVLFRRISKIYDNEYFWLIMDGPVDTFWIENLNSVLDDNKTLTLANGDRIIMSPNSKLIFETDNIDNASPATVSRLGMVYMSPSVLQWTDILMSWEARSHKNVTKFAKMFIGDIFADLLNFIITKLSPKMKISQNAYFKQCTDILDSLVLLRSDAETSVVLKLTMYSIIWSLGALLDAKDRKIFQKFIVNHPSNPPLPKLENTNTQSIYDYYVNEQGDWIYWGNEIPEFAITSNQKFSEMIVPNIESTQMTYILKLLWDNHKPVLLIGDQGTGKTITIQQLMGSFNLELHLTKKLNFSSLTKPDLFQKTIEGYVDKRTGAIYGPPGHKKLTLFIDDLNMPMINEWGDQTTNEIVRQLMEFEGFFSLSKPGDFIQIQDIQFLAAMINPGGGQNDIPDRLKRQFTVFSCTLPSETSIDMIFMKIAQIYFQPSLFNTEVVDFIPNLVTITRKLWQITKDTLLPSPSKFHYIFNLRDVSRIWQGMLQIKPNECQNIEDILKLWLHETTRVIADRCNAVEDRNFIQETQRSLILEFEPKIDGIIRGDIIFVNFLGDIPEVEEDDSGSVTNEALLEPPKVYEVLNDIEKCINRANMFMEQYNESVRGGKLNLVLFPDALMHLVIVSRIINMERGNALLVGIGGFGKKSLAKLATYIAGYKFCQITITAGYNTTNFLEDIKKAYKAAGLGDGVTFLFSDSDVVDEAFLDYLNNLLSSGEIPNLFTKEELNDITNELSTKLLRTHEQKPEYTHDQLIEIFTTTAKGNFHLVLCFSPVGTSLREWTIQFPGLMSGCTIDWFQDWPESARLSVAEHIFMHFEIVSEDSTVKNRLVRSISNIHGIVQNIAVDYFERFRRKVYIIPKKFLNFLQTYMDFYMKKKLQIENMSKRMSDGIQKLLDAAESIKVLKIELESKEKYIREATETVEKALTLAEESTMVAEDARNKVMNFKTQSQILVENIKKDKNMAEVKLDKAKPALDEAEAALRTIKPADISTVRKLGTPPHLVELIMDVVLIYLNEKMGKVAMDKDKKFLVTSYKTSLKVMSGTKFLPRLINYKKDRINSETMDLLVPYLRFSKYNIASAKTACGNVAGLLQWTIAMTKYFEINREVLPLKAALTVQEAKYNIATRELEKAEGMLQERESELVQIQDQLNVNMIRKNKVQTEATECQNKLDAASQLISGLGDEKIRWAERIEQFKLEIQKLVGDIFYTSGFLTYSGSFNEEYRAIIIKNLQGELIKNTLPGQENLNLIQYFVDRSVVSEWLLHGLPDDAYSVQNGIFVTQSDKFPLLIDPQSQGVAWIEHMEAKNKLIVLQQYMKNFEMQMENAIESGSVVLLKDVEEKLDPCLSNILDKNLIKSGTTLKVTIVDKEVIWNDNFKLYITTKLENPLYSPEIASMATIVDFTVTLTGLENQILGRVIRSEKAELEQQRIQLIEDIARDTKTMEDLEQNLLLKLSSIEGSILDDLSLIQMLNYSKATSIDIKKKMISAEMTEAKINRVREEYRPIAKRGSILYFLLSTLPKICHMYRTSLAQFLIKIDESLRQAKPSLVLAKRIAAIIDKITITVYKFQSRGLYEKHRYTLALLMALKIDLQEEKITNEEYEYFVKAGSGMEVSNAPKNQFPWLHESIWLNIVQLSKISKFSNILDQMSNAEKLWRIWMLEDNPENVTVPFKTSPKDNLSQLQKLLLIRACCSDRVLGQSQKYISESLGNEYLQPILINFDELTRESNAVTPLICLLSMGSDPTADITDLAKKQEIQLYSVSMGQGQEILARKLYDTVMSHEGSWLLIQNSHLALDYLDELFLALAKKEKEEYLENTRIWMTSADVDSYPINLLQRSIKYTNDPPSSLKASLKITYGNLTQDTLDLSNSKFYIPLIYAISFMHTIVQERRKYGPIGWNTPYEFNYADWLSSCLFVQNHLLEVEARNSTRSNVNLNWSAIRYMLSEVHYGGRVTDNIDKRLLTAYAQMWFTDTLVNDDFYLQPGIPIIKLKTQDEYLKYFDTMEDIKGPEICGLHKNVEINYNVMVAENIFNNIILVEAKGSAGLKDNESRETVVSRQAISLLQKVPALFNIVDVEEKLAEMGSLDPMAIFLKQEINSMQYLLEVISRSLRDLQMAIDGMIVMTSSLQDTMDTLYNNGIPKIWHTCSWPTTEKLGFWFGDLIKRYEYLRSWCFISRPNLFWFSGMFNPNGFLTAIRQEGVKNHRGDWPLDKVTLDNEVLSIYATDCQKKVKNGVLVYGMVLEGASWDRKNSALCDFQTKIIHTQMPVIHIFATIKVHKNFDSYDCPVYRTITRKNYVTSLRLKTVKKAKEKDTNWILRGAALITKSN